MPDPLRRTSSSWRSVFSPGRSRSSRTSDTPVAPVSPRLELAQQPFDPVCLGRFPRLSVKMRRFVRPEVPSVTGGHSCTCTSRFRFRVRSRESFRSGPALGIPSPAIPHASLSRRRGYRALDPRPRTSPRFAIFTRSADTRFSGSRLPPTDFCNFTSDARTRSRASDSRLSSRWRFTRLISKVPSLSPVCLGTRDLPLSKKDREMLRTVTALLVPRPRRCKYAADHDTRSSRPITAPLAGDAWTRPSFAVMAVGRQR